MPVFIATRSWPGTHRWFGAGTSARSRRYCAGNVKTLCRLLSILAAEILVLDAGQLLTHAALNTIIYILSCSSLYPANQSMKPTTPDEINAMMFATNTAAAHLGLARRMYGTFSELGTLKSLDSRLR